jgi:hypothetical protein
MDFWSSFRAARKFFAASVISVSGDAKTFRAVRRATKATGKMGNRMGLSR